MSLFEKLSGFTVERFSRERVMVLRNRYHAVRTRLHPVLRLVNGSFGVDELQRHLVERLRDDFEILMVHTSVNHMAPMFTGSPLELLQMLVAFCGEHRTLAMPAFYFGDPRAADALAAYQTMPCFDVRRTPSQMGIVGELFRRSPGVRQSLHPTHRIAARGPLAALLTVGHERAVTPCGAGTPFEFMAARETVILGIGKPIEVLTQVHHVEDLLGDRFPLPSEVRRAPVRLRDAEGIEHPYTLQLRRFQARRDMWRLRRLMPAEHLREWTFHGVPLFSTRARDVTEDLLAAALRGDTVLGRPSAKSRGR